MQNSMAINILFFFRVFENAMSTLANIAIGTKLLWLNENVIYRSKTIFNDEVFEARNLLQYYIYQLVNQVAI